MNRMIWIASCAALALTAPAAAKERKDDRQASVERPQKARQAERTQRAERTSRGEARVQRAERTSRGEARVQRAERAPREEARLQRAERSKQEARVERLSSRQERQILVPRRAAESAQRRDRSIEHSHAADRQIMGRRIEPRAAERRDRRIAEPQVDRRATRIERGAVEPRMDRRADRFERRAQQADRRVERQLQAIERRDARIDRAEIAPARSWQALAERRAVAPVRVRFNADSGRDFSQAVQIGQRVDPDWYGDYVPITYRARYFDTPDYYYRYDDDFDYLYRIDRDDDIVSALIPLMGSGYYWPGQSMPYAYRSSWVPYGYQGLYYDTPDYYYRYAGSSIYQVDAGTQLIMGLAALLTGQNFGIGQMLPSTYNVYNVPLGYRDQYYDTADAWYRYDDGYVYQVDPYSRLIEASYPIYGGGYNVGQPWPVAYPGYNVPYGYRDLYYDTPDWQYRYANGAIYQVNPQTQLIQALVALVTGNQFAVGQPLPMGYDVYNVPLGWRDRYYDTADSWYRYDDGYIYEVDPHSGMIERAIQVYA